MSLLDAIIESLFPSRQILFLRIFWLGIGLLCGWIIWGGVL